MRERAIPEAREAVNRVVVVGVGAVTAQGLTAEDLWDGVKAGRVAIRPVRQIPMEGFGTRIGGEAQPVYLPKHYYRRPEGYREPAIDFAIRAAEEAMLAAGLDFDHVPPERWAVVMGTCNAGLLSAEDWYAGELVWGSQEPGLLLLAPPQALAEAVSGAFGLKGPVLSVNTACAAGANAIGYAAELIRAGHADAALAGGADALSDFLFAGFSALESLSPRPAAPYSRSRQGLSLGEGSGMLVLVREDLARRFALSMLAEVAGYGLSADGYHPTAPHPEGEGAARAIRAALAAAGVSPEQVGYINGHGTGTAKNDAAETNAIRLALGAAADRASVSSTKSMIGHLLGAAGAVEAIVTTRALVEQLAPPTANYEATDPECDLDYVPNAARPVSTDVALSTNFAFGGANACLVLARPRALTTPLPRPELDRVVVTGLATLTSAGCDVDEVYQAVATSRPSIQVEDGVPLGRVRLDASPFLAARDQRRMDRLGIFAVVASQLALRDAGVEVSAKNRHRVGVVFGTGLGPMETMERFVGPLLHEGPSAANPAIFPNTVYNAAAGHVAVHFGTVGPTSTVTALHAAGASAICYGRDLVADGRADALLCVAADTLTDAVIRAYRQLGLLSPAGGFALAEAGASLILERLGHARARGARIYGEVLGYGIASDGLGVGAFDPWGRGLARAMRLAVERSGLKPADVSGIWAGYSGYRAADRAEAAAIRRVVGTQTRVAAPKLLLGEPIGVGGALSAALALKGWQRAAHGLLQGPALVNSSSLGGTHFSIVLAPYRESTPGRETGP